MLFGDEKRFSKKLVSSSVDSQVLAVAGNTTDVTVGPGAYYNSSLEEKRGGWGNKSFSHRSPQSPNQSILAHQNSPIKGRDLYGSAVVTSYGAIAMPPSPVHHCPVPGPGAYNSNPNALKPRPKTPTTPRAPRFQFSNSLVVRDGVVFQSAENNVSELGPGYYAVEMDHMNKPSFNVRATKGKPALSPNPNRSPSTPRDRLSRQNSASGLATTPRNSSAPRARRLDFNSSQ